MAIFKYILPSGAKYTVQAPDGYTQIQADRAFYEQVAAGNLVGYRPGQTLASAATKLANFGLSRLQRGTAGVDITTILAIVFDSPVIAPVPDLSGIPLKNPITASDIVNVGPVTPVGPLTANETAAVIAQIGNIVDQDPTVVSPDGGVGTYGLTPIDLEETGYVKPGTSNYPDVVCALQSPSVWTGKNGISNLDLLLNDGGAQTRIENELLQTRYNSLVASGVIQESAPERQKLSTGQVYTSSGQFETVTAATLLAGTAALTGNLGGVVKNALGNVNIAGIEKFLSNPVDNLTSLANGAVNSVTQSIAGLNTQALAQANQLANNAINNITGTVNSLTSNFTNLSSGAVNALTGDLSKIASSLTTNLAGDVGALITNASQYGTQVTKLWAQGSDLLNGGLNAVTGQVSSVVSGISGQLNTITSAAGAQVGALTSQFSGLASGAIGDLTNLVQGSVGSLGAEASSLLADLGSSLDLGGAMGSFSVDFSVFSSDSLVSLTKPAPGFNNTVNRDTVTAAMTRILNSGKIPIPDFEYPSIESSLVKLDIIKAKDILASIKTAGSQVVNTVTGTINQGTQLASTVQAGFNRII
jgi:hypothetical protein